MREIERKLNLSRTSLRTYKERAEQSGKSMQELQSLEDAELHGLLTKADIHRGRDEAVKSNFFFNNFKKFSFQQISAFCIQHKVGHFCYSL